MSAKFVKNMKCISLAIIAILLQIPFVCLSQNNWTSIPNELNKGIRSLEISSDSSGLLLGGTFSFNSAVELNGIAKWAENIGFQSLNGGSQNCSDIGCIHPIVDMIGYKNELYVGVQSDIFQQEIYNGVAKWDGLEWSKLPGGLRLLPPIGIGQGRASSFEILDDTLYIGGTFQLVDSVEINDIVKWDGSNWYSLDFPSPLEITNTNFVYDIHRFNDDLYICGNIAVYDGNQELVIDILKYDGKNWSSVSNNPLEGSVGQLNCLVDFKGELYAAGSILDSENPGLGNGIIRLRNGMWEGINLEGNSGVIYDMLVYDELLFVVGNFEKIGNVTSKYMAIFDGEQWYSILSDFDDVITTLKVFNDELFVGGYFQYIDGIYSPHFAKWKCLDNLQSCDIFVSIHNFEEPKTSFEVSPNPSNGQIKIIDNGQSQKNTIAEIYSNSGKLLKVKEFKGICSFSNLEQGFYFLKISQINNKSVSIHKLVVY